MKCELPHLACSVYYSTLQDLPAMVRLWWNSQEKRVSTVVERFTMKYISPVLSAQEISFVHCSTQIFDSMTVCTLYDSLDNLSKNCFLFVNSDQRIDYILHLNLLDANCVTFIL